MATNSFKDKKTAFDTHERLAEDIKRLEATAVQAKSVLNALPTPHSARRWLNPNQRRKGVVCDRISDIEQDLRAKRREMESAAATVLADTGLDYQRLTKTRDDNPNSPSTVMKVVLNSTRVDPDLAVAIAQNTGDDPSTYWAFKLNPDLYSADASRHWTNDAVVLCQNQSAAASLPEGTVLLRTLRLPLPSSDRFEPACRVIESKAKPGQRWDFNAGLSTTILGFHWLGADDVLLRFHGVTAGVQLVHGGITNSTGMSKPGENEVFVAEPLSCEVVTVQSNVPLSTSSGTSGERHFKYVVDLQVL